MKQCLGRLTNSGIMRNGEFLTLDFTDYRRTEKECILSQILEKEVAQKYYLSEEMVSRIKWREPSKAL